MAAHQKACVIFPRSHSLTFLGGVGCALDVAFVDSSSRLRELLRSDSRCRLFLRDSSSFRSSFLRFFRTRPSSRCFRLRSESSVRLCFSESSPLSDCLPDCLSEPSRSRRSRRSVESSDQPLSFEQDVSGSLEDGSSPTRVARESCACGSNLRSSRAACCRSTA